jgi:5-methyltetrahydrofolate--homocysteine methyltransferase
MTKTQQHPLEKILENRIAIIDGAMGTTIRTYGMSEADIRGERFQNSTKDLLNNGDLFSLTQPDMICDIHRRFLDAGADIIETLERPASRRANFSWRIRGSAAAVKTPSSTRRS